MNIGSQNILEMFINILLEIPFYSTFNTFFYWRLYIHQKISHISIILTTTFFIYVTRILDYDFWGKKLEMRSFI